jgi:hypothetical protein
MYKFRQPDKNSENGNFWYLFDRDVNKYSLEIELDDLYIGLINENEILY